MILCKSLSPHPSQKLLQMGMCPQNHNRDASHQSQRRLHLLPKMVMVLLQQMNFIYHHIMIMAKRQTLRCLVMIFLLGMFHLMVLDELMRLLVKRIVSGIVEK